jgi:hypothetical protein
MKYTITSRFGDMESGLRSRPHTGIDFAMDKGEKIHSVSDGTIQIENYGHLNSGKTVLVDDGNGHKFIYGHLSQFKVHNGQHIQNGDVIGYAGSTGNSTGSHLHFGVRDGSHYVDPSSYIPNIEHMNDKLQIAHHIQQTHSFADAIHSQLNIYSDLLHNIKLNFINLIHSVDYSVFVQQFQEFIDLFF